MTFPWTIVITACSTFLVTMGSQLLLDRIRRTKPKLLLDTKKAVPIPIGDKMVGAYVTTVSNPSRHTIKEVSINMRAGHASIRSGGIKTSQGMAYQESQKEDGFEVTVPFMKPDEHIAITAIAESSVFIPDSAEVSVRSPESFALLSDSNPGGRPPKRFLLTSSMMGALVASVAVATAVLEPSMMSVRQANVLAVAAEAAQLGDLTRQYALAKDLYYYPQAALAFALAREATSSTVRARCRDFLIRVPACVGNNMRAESRCAFSYYLAQSFLLDGMTNEAAGAIDAAHDASEDHLEWLTNARQ